MARSERIKVELALAVLKTVADVHFVAEVERGPALRLALRVLMPHVSKHELRSFWIVTGNPNPGQRSHILRRQLTHIETLARRSVGADGA